MYPFSKVFRLRKSYQYNFVMQEKKFFTGKALTIYYRFSPTKEPKMGMTVSRKYGNAVQRNLFKRKARESYRRHRPNLPQDIQIVLFPRYCSKQIDLFLIEQDFALLKKYLQKSLLATL